MNAPNLVTTAPDAVVAVADLTKRYGDQAALDRTNVVVPAGTIHGILGPNGAGKTTLLSVLLGLVRPDAGDVKLFGRARETARATWLDSVGGFVEAPRFYPYLSGRRNLEFLAGLDGGDAASLIDDALEIVGLAGAANQRAGGYSLGMRQRLGVAASLIRRPKLLILDEPAGGLDPHGRQDLDTGLRGLAQRGMTVILSSHDIAALQDLCDTVTVLNRGRIVFAGSFDELRRRAPAPTWHLVTADDRAAAAIAGTVDGVSVSTDERGSLVIGGEQDLIDHYVVALGRSGIAVRQLVSTMTALEALYFELTDRTGGPAQSRTDAQADEAS
jgi:ABC-2 type transport system ATP-binding protein